MLLPIHMNSPIGSPLVYLHLSLAHSKRRQDHSQFNLKKLIKLSHSAFRRMSLSTLSFLVIYCRTSKIMKKTQHSAVRIRTFAIKRHKSRFYPTCLDLSFQGQEFLKDNISQMVRASAKLLIMTVI